MKEWVNAYDMIFHHWDKLRSKRNKEESDEASRYLY